MKCSKLFLAALLGSVLFVSCSDDDVAVNEPFGAYQGGFFVLNEGNATASSVTFINYNYSLNKQDIFGAENDAAQVGGYAQSIFFNAEKAFVISSKANNIAIVNRYTFKMIDQVNVGLSNPRYGVVIGGKAYVTNQADLMDYTDDFVTVIDLADNTVEDSFPVGAIAEKITVENGKLYILNGTYGFGNSVTVMNPETGAIDDTIALPQSPNSFQVAGGKLYVLTGDYTNPSHLVRISLATNDVENDITFPSDLVNAQNLNIENGQLYFSVNAKIYDEPIAATAVSATELFTSGAVNLYGFAVMDGSLYVTDAKDYVSDGQVLVYSTAGTLVHTEPTGLIPNSVYFN